MAANDTVLKLLALERTQRRLVILNAARVYMQILFNLANDIYDSCIADYYDGYVPTSYTRHGNLAGFNLYRANSNTFIQNYVSVNIIEDKLLPYNKKTEKGEVFDNVVNGIRGTGMGRNREGWPRHWDTSYPNSFSAYRNVWRSSGHTIQEIYDDFFANVVTDTADLFWKSVDRLV